MPTPTIPAGNLFMNATLFTATGTTQTVQNGVAGQSFQPDFVWQKARNQAYGHLLVDSVRGASKYLASDSTAAEQTQAQFLTSFNSDGFSLGTTNTPNGTTMVGWQWKAGGAAVTNTAGSITSQVSANTTSGFSIVTYTGTGANATVGHGLGVAPSMYIIKRRNAGGDDWATYHISTGNTQFLRLNTTAAAQTFNLWQNTTPSSSVFYLTSDVGVNGSASTYVAYCWAPIAGYSAFGSYTGNGSADGPFIYTGFRPKFVMFKATDSGGGDWYTYDTSRNTYNATTLALSPNLSSAEITQGSLDILSNGFKFRATNNPNVSGANYIYMAFAENPTKFALAR